MRFCTYIVTAVLLGQLGLARGAQSGPETINGIAVKVNDAVITLRDIEDQIQISLLRLEDRYGSQPQAFRQKVEQLKSDTLELLVERQLMLDEFKNAGYKMTESYVNEEIKRRIRNQFGDRVRMIKTLEHEGMTEASFRQRIREEIIVNFLEYKNASADKIIVSPHKIETYYTEHADKFKVEDEVKLRMIFLANKPDRDAEATKKEAERILSEIKGGASFAEKASEYSDGAYKSEGGLRPAMDRETLAEDLSKVAFALKPGELSGVVDRDDGCYIMKVEEFHPAHVKSLNEVSAEIERTLASEEQRRLRKEWIERLKAKSFISYFPIS